MEIFHISFIKIEPPILHTEFQGPRPGSREEYF